MDPEKKSPLPRSSNSDQELEAPMDQHSPPRRDLVTSSVTSNPQHDLFCRIVGMPANFPDASYPSIWNVTSKKERAYKGLYPRVRKAYQWQTMQYWIVASLANALVWLQICFGAILTALGGLRETKVSVVIMVLGALQTVYGGLITYFKSRNQPNRSRQYRNALKHILDAIEDAEEMLRDPSFTIPPYTPGTSNLSRSVTTSQSGLSGGPTSIVNGVPGLVLKLMDMYLDAVREAEANNPDFWFANKREHDQGDPNAVKEILSQLRQSGNIQPGDAPASDKPTVQSANVPTSTDSALKTDAQPTPAAPSPPSAAAAPPAGTT